MKTKFKIIEKKTSLISCEAEVDGQVVKVGISRLKHNLTFRQANRLQEGDSVELEFDFSTAGSTYIGADGQARVATGNAFIATNNRTYDADIIGLRQEVELLRLNSSLEKGF